MKNMVQHFRGPKALYNLASHGHGIYFTTDTNEIILNGVSYSGQGSEAFEVLRAQVDSNSNALEILNGTGEGSVLKTVDNAINKFASEVSDDNTVNTFKELVDYAATHSSEMLELVGDITAVKEKNEEQDTRIGELEVLINGSDEEGAVSLLETVAQHEEAISQLSSNVDAVDAKADENATDIESLKGLVGETTVSEQIDSAMAWEDVE